MPEMHVRRFDFSRRHLSFFGCIYAGLFCGTNYVFSSYAPQLSERAHLTALEINLVGICGNMGVYLLGPFAGGCVDAFGVKKPLALAGALLFAGYFGMYQAYIREWQHAAASLCLFSFLTGVGSSLGNSAMINASAKSFPDNRGTATAFPIATYGLSAFVFSRLSHGLFAGKTAEFLLTLALACGISLTLCSVVVGIYPPPTHLSQRRAARRKSSGSTERETLLDRDDDVSDDEVEAPVRATHRHGQTAQDLTGLALIKNYDFQLMISIIALLSGCGLMYINNVSNTLVALLRYETGLDDRAALEVLQQLNVSVLSIFNCLGRIWAGVVSDLAKQRFGIQRSAFLLASAVIFLVLNVCILANRSSGSVVFFTALMGFAYGEMFGIAPVLTSELFGLRWLSTNWGMMSMAPGVSGNVFNLIFGHVYDSHSDPDTHICTDGADCYRSAFLFTGIGVFVAVILATVLFWHHMKEARAARKHGERPTS